MAPTTVSLAAAPQQSATWNDLPTEVLLDIVSNLDFDSKTFQSLHLVNKRLNKVLQNYERSLSLGFATRQLRLTIPRFPDLVCPSCHNTSCHTGPTFRLLSEITSRTTAIADLTALVIANYGCWVDGWHKTFEAGLLLLYRIQERASYDAKVAFISSCPASSLAAIFIALSQCLRAAENGGAGLIHRDNQPADPAARSDVHLVFEDLTLQFGPQFVLDVMRGDGNAAHVLHEKWLRLDDEQMHDSDGNPPRKSLISHLKRCFSNQTACGISRVMSEAMWMASQRPLKSLSDVGIVELVRGPEDGEWDEV